MVCPKCHADTNSLFLSESFPCAECGKINVWEHHMCFKCNTVWRALNGVLWENTVFDFSEIGQVVFNFDNDLEDMTDVTDVLMESIEKQSRVEKGEAKMSDYIHRCLRCNAIAVSTDDLVFKCTKCDFEWEIIKYDS